MNAVQKWTAIGLLSLAPVIASAQNQPEPPVLQFNNASILASHSITLALYPPQVGALLGISELQTTTGALGSFSISPTDNLKIGTGIIGTTTVTYKGVRTNAVTPIIAASITSKLGQSGLGVKMTCKGNGDVLTTGPISILALHQSQFGNYTGKLGIEYAPGTDNYTKSALLSAELVKGSVGASATLQMIEKSKAKLSLGIEKGLGKGWQIGASVHPEYNFFRGKLGPCIEMTKRGSFGRVTGYYSPQAKTVNATVRLLL